MIKHLLTESGWAGQDNIWLLVIVHGPSCAWRVCHDLEPNILPPGPTDSVNKYLVYNGI